MGRWDGVVICNASLSLTGVSTSRTQKKNRRPPGTGGSSVLCELGGVDYVCTECATRPTSPSSLITLSALCVSWNTGTHVVAFMG